jgi:hypothetical protein
MNIVTPHGNDVQTYPMDRRPWEIAPFFLGKTKKDFAVENDKVGYILFA